MTKAHLAEATEVVTHWWKYRQSYVQLCNKMLLQRGIVICP